MSKESIKASIESVKGRIAQKKNDIANIKSRKREVSERLSANIKNASSPSTKESYRREKASVIAYHEQQIRIAQGYLASLQKELASLRTRLKSEK